MTSVPSLSAISQIEILSRWSGFADPPSHSAKLTITHVGDRFVRQRAIEGSSDELPESAISQLLTALVRPTIPHLDPTLFDMPSAVIDRHYNSMWTDDYPSHLIRIHCDAGRQITIQSDAQHAFMLPLKITDSATAAPYETFDPELSRSLATLMPAGYLDCDRLAGRLGLLECECAEAESQEIETVSSMEPTAAPIEADHDKSAFTSHIDIQTEMFRILFGEESAQEAREAEQAGRLSERLLKRNSLETAQDLLARGADPSIVDDMGQTALMHAASPPCNRERFRLLVAAGADLESRRDGLTGLHLACIGGEADAAAEWVLAGADVRARSPGGATPLMLGATWPRIVRTLLDNRAEVNAKDDDGHGALVYAILRQRSVSAQGQLEAIQSLIHAGADVNLRDRAGVSPLGHAKKVLATELLDEEVVCAFNPQADRSSGMDWSSRTLAEAVVKLLTAAEAVE